MAIFSTVVVGCLVTLARCQAAPLVDYHLQKQASVAGQHILGLLAGKLLLCQLSPPLLLL